MKNENLKLKIGGVYLLKTELTFGKSNVTHVEVESIRRSGDQVFGNCILGKYRHDDFIRRTFFDANNSKVSRVELGSNVFAKFIKLNKEENKMVENKNTTDESVDDLDALVNDLTVELDAGIKPVNGSALKAAAKASTPAKKTQDEKNADASATKKTRDDAKAAAIKVKADLKAQTVKDKADKSKADKDKTEADKKQALVLAKNLNDEEKIQRSELEKQIADHIEQFETATFEIGAGLTLINGQRLYRNTHDTFEAYVEDVWQFSRPQAYSIINASKTFGALKELNLAAKDMPSIRAAEALSRGVDRLLKASNLADNPEKTAITKQVARNVYEMASQQAEKNRDGSPILSPSLIDGVFAQLEQGKIKVGRKEIALNLAAPSVGEMFQTKPEDLQKAQDAFKTNLTQAVATIKSAPKTSRLDQALNKATGNDAQGKVKIPDGVVPRLTVMDSVFGKTTIVKAAFDRIELACGNVYIDTPEGWIFSQNLNIKVETAEQIEETADVE